MSDEILNIRQLLEHLRKSFESLKCASVRVRAKVKPDKVRTKKLTPSVDKLSQKGKSYSIVLQALQKL